MSRLAYIGYCRACAIVHRDPEHSGCMLYALRREQELREEAERIRTELARLRSVVRVARRCVAGGCA